MAGLTNQPYMAYSTRDTPLAELQFEYELWKVGRIYSIDIEIDSWYQNCDIYIKSRNHLGPTRFYL